MQPSTISTHHSPAAGATALLEPVQEKALALLEFPQVLERLARHATFGPSRDIALQWRPALAHDDAVALQAETAEASRLLDTGVDPGLADASDTRPIVSRAGRHGLLTGPELLAVAGTLAALRKLQEAVLRRHDAAPRLAALAHALPGDTDLEHLVFRSFDGRGELLDNASTELRAARAAARRSHDHLHAALTRLVRDGRLEETLQEPIVTIRGGRLVLPVKSERRRELRGLVHDASDSGATLFVEPLSTIDLGNDLQEAQAMERREVERILRHLSEVAAALAPALDRGIEAGAQLDFIFARARFSRSIAGVPPALIPPEKPLHIDIAGVRHPLLTGDVEPVSVEIGGEHTVLLVTGPNTGGKTVTLKSVGLCVLMAQAGLHVPARHARLSTFASFFADIGDQQSIEQSVSSFSSHVINLREALAQAGPHALVLLDELGASTDPDEGAALAKAVLRALRDSQALVVANTHHRGVAAFAQSQAGMLNASMEFDPDTLAPTYRLHVGLPGRSFALDIANRLGLPAPVLDDARSMVDQDQLRLEDLLAEVQRRQDDLTQQGHHLAKTQAEVDELRETLRARQMDMEERQAHLLEQTRKDLLDRASRLARRLRNAERRWQQPSPVQPADDGRQQIREVQQELASPEWRPPVRESPGWREQLKPGDTVRIQGFYQPARVDQPPDLNNDAIQVSLGPLRMRLDLAMVERREQEAPPRPTRIDLPPPPPSLSPELQILGLTVDEALDRLESFLNDAILAGLDEVRIVHGKGTGALRRAVRERLSSHPLVAAHSPAPLAQGGDGATNASLS